MGNEVEMKVILTEEEYLFCAKAIDNFNTKLLIRTDNYFSRYGSFEKGREYNEPLIRIAKEESLIDVKKVFTIKRKSIVNGVELNKELECEYHCANEDEDPVRALLMDTGYEVIFKKNKRKIGAMISYKDISIHVELEILNGEVFAIELEYTSEVEDGKLGEIIAAEKGILKDVFNIDPSRVDNSSWKDILKDHPYKGE